MPEILGYRKIDSKWRIALPSRIIKELKIKDEDEVFFQFIPDDNHLAIFFRCPSVKTEWFKGRFKVSGKEQLGRILIPESVRSNISFSLSREEESFLVYDSKKKKIEIISGKRLAEAS